MGAAEQDQELYVVPDLVLERLQDLDRAPGGAGAQQRGGEKLARAPVSRHRVDIALELANRLLELVLGVMNRARQKDAGHVVVERPADALQRLLNAGPILLLRQHEGTEIARQRVPGHPAEHRVDVGDGLVLAVEVDQRGRAPEARENVVAVDGERLVELRDGALEVAPQPPELALQRAGLGGFGPARQRDVDFPFGFVHAALVDQALGEADLGANVLGIEPIGFAKRGRGVVEPMQPEKGLTADDQDSGALGPLAEIVDRGRQRIVVAALEKKRAAKQGT